jgi:hypothetical protein
MELARVGPTQGDGEFIELAPGVSEIPPHKGSGKIVKRDDHLMDATRYLIVIGRRGMCIRPSPSPGPDLSA